MKQFIKDHFSDCSNEEQFCFSLTCAECGAVWKSTPIRFSKAGISPPTEGKKIIYEACYEQELRSARQAAVRYAAEHLNYCPICKRLVCNRCFLICDDLDMCKQCASHLEETGTPVATDVLDTAM